MSIPDNVTEASWITLIQARGLDKPHRPAILSPAEITTPDIGQTLVHTRGFDKLITLYLSRLLPRTSDILLRHWTISFACKPTQSLGGLMYCPRSKKYTWHLTWNSETHVNPPCQPWNKSMDTRPLAAELPN